MFSFLYITLSLFLASAVQAHFQLQYPPPRGVFVEKAEPGFCDGYINPTGNRTRFPLSGGMFSWNSEHPSWVAAFFISTTNATSFNDFSQVNGFFQATGEGVVCASLDLKSSNATGLTNGQNVTVQVLFDGGDGALYQCADLILDDSAQQGVLGPPCTKNITTSASPAPADSKPNSGMRNFEQAQNGLVLGLVGVLALAGVTLL